MKMKLFVVAVAFLLLLSGMLVAVGGEMGDEGEQEIDAPNYELTVNIDGEGTVEVNGEAVEDGWTGDFGAGTEVTLEAIPDGGWTFGEWTGDITGTGEMITIGMDEDKATTAHFKMNETTYFGVELTEHDEDVVEGEEMTINYEITNWGQEQGKQNILFEVDGEQEDVKLDLTLNSEETYNGEFVWTPEEAGEYELEVSSDDETDNATVKILQPANFEVDVIDHDENVTTGDEITIRYEVNNTGEVQGTQNIVFKVDGKRVDANLDLTLDANENYTDEFTWEANETGERNLKVGSDDDETTIVVNVEEDSDSGIPGFTTMLLLLSAVVAVAIYYQKKQWSR